MNELINILDNIIAENKNITKKELLEELFDKATKHIINDKKYTKEFEYTLAQNIKDKQVIIFYLECWTKLDRSDKPKVIYLTEDQKTFMTRVLTSMVFEDNGALFEANTFKMSFDRNVMENIAENLKPLNVDVKIQN
jgi:hypothetical protein